MIGQEQSITVANNMTLIIPELCEKKLALAMKEEVGEYIRKTIHNPYSLGWPDPADDFPSMGIVLQALDEKTARVLLVAGDLRARTNVALHCAAYAHMGFTLLIDQATFLREIPEENPSEHENDSTKADGESSTVVSPDPHGMEVA
jgi:hypothetical protein